MRKRYILAIPVALIVILAAIWGAMNAHALHLNQTAAGASHNLTSTPTVNETSLYLTGSRVIPTVAVPNSTANCDPAHLPTPDSAERMAQDISPVIKPHLCGIPTFTIQDVRHFMSTVTSFSGRRIQQISPHYTITRILFVTNQVANGILNADTGIADDDSQVICYIEVYGDFTVASPFPSNKKPTVLHHGQIVIDGVTGTMLTMGVEP